MFNETAYNEGLGLDWGSIINNGINQAPNVINAARGPQFGRYNPYGVGGSGTTTLSPYGLSSTGGFNISTNTLVIVGLVGALILLTRKK